LNRLESNISPNGNLYMGSTHQERLDLFWKACEYNLFDNPYTMTLMGWKEINTDYPELTKIQRRNMEILGEDLSAYTEERARIEPELFRIMREQE
jgi:hypothetical protein